MILVSELQVEKIEIIITSKSHRYIFTDSRFTVGLFAIELVVLNHLASPTVVLNKLKYFFRNHINLSVKKLSSNFVCEAAYFT